MRYPLVFAVILFLRNDFALAAGSASQIGCGWTGAGDNTASSDLSVPGNSSNIQFAKDGQFPWVVAVINKSFSKDKKMIRSLTVGVVINPSVVLTTAISLPKSIEDNIVRPCQEVSKNQECAGDRSVLKTVTHEQFDAKTGANNIALLFVEPFGTEVGYACLATVPLPAETQSEYLHWGVKINSRPGKLKKTTAISKSRENCNVELGKSRFGDFFRMPPSLECTMMRSSQDEYRVDAGSPLVTAMGERYTVHGIKAYYVPPLTTPHFHPITYTPIYQQIDWIKRNLAEEKHDATTFIKIN